jgi:RNA polymerase sigma factor (TIGR02999 family)
MTETTRPTEEVTRILRRIAGGHRDDLDRLITVVYDELRALARGHLRRERPDHTLQPTALVHEVFLRLVNQRELAWHDRAHFFGAASELIRRILVDHARARASGKRGGERQRLTLSATDAAEPADGVDLIALDDALQHLAAIDERQARIVELRYFGGLTVPEVADLLEIGRRTVDREWCVARTWLYRTMTGVERRDPKDAGDGSGSRP